MHFKLDIHMLPCILAQCFLHSFNFCQILVQIFYLIQYISQIDSPQGSTNQLFLTWIFLAFYGSCIIFTTLRAINGFFISKYLARLMTLLMFVFQHEKTFEDINKTFVHLL